VARHVEGDRALRALGLALPPVLALYASFDRGFAISTFPGRRCSRARWWSAWPYWSSSCDDVRAQGVRRAWSMPFLGLLVAWGAVRLLPEVQVYGLGRGGTAT
jgi:hypothetical protein